MLEAFNAELEQLSTEEDLKPFDAHAQFCMNLWGLTDGDGATRSDGRGDRGIDWYRVDKEQAEIWQFKGTQTISKDAFDRSATPADFQDLRRVTEYIRTIDELKGAQNPKVKEFQSRARLAISNAAENGVPEFAFLINYVLARSELTEQVRAELQDIRKVASSTLTIRGVRIRIDIQVQLVDDILSEMWRSQNTEWKEISGKQSEWIELTAKGNIIDDGKCHIFFCRAKDLVTAYNDLGQRLFAPNVRCYLADTPVNARIRNAIRTKKGIDSFQYMNNGVTLIGENVEKKNLGKLRIRRPGVINGLQTIRALFDGYAALDDKLQQYFEENCFVLVRCFAGNKKSLAIDDLIVATNNQNKMEARNLKSNTDTQKNLERRFAEIGWFYERKEKAWDAFVESDGTWDTLPGKKPANFGGRSKPDRKNIDNSIVATSWLAFSGYSDIARNRKSQIFEDERLYVRIFEKTPNKHGFDYEFRANGPIEDDETTDQVPSAGSLLLASLVYQTAKQITPSTAEIRRRFVSNLGLERLSSDQQAAELSKHPDYLANLMMCSSPFLFAELYGFMFFRVHPESRAKAATKVLKETDIKSVYKQKDYSALAKKIDDEPGDLDFFVAYFQMWQWILAELADSGPFRDELTSASSRPSFLHGSQTRKRILDRVKELDQQIKRRGALDKPWSAPFDSRGSISDALKRFAEG